MKRFILLIVFAALSFSASAQSGEFYYGAKLGINVANMAAKDAGDPVVRMNIGLTTDYRFTYRFGLGTELFYSGTGTSMMGIVEIDGEEKEDAVHLNMNYINLPILAKVYIVGGLNLEAGAQVGVLVSSAINYRGQKEQLKDNNLNKVEFSVPVGLMYDFDNGLTVSARMQLGITEVLEGDKNNIFSVGVGYKF